MVACTLDAYTRLCDACNGRQKLAIHALYDLMFVGGVMLGPGDGTELVGGVLEPFFMLFFVIYLFFMLCIFYETQLSLQSMFWN